MDRYETSLALMNTVITRDKPGKTILQAWDDLYRFIHENFECPKNYLVEINDVAEFFLHSRDEILRRLREKPPEYSEQLFPIAIARHLLRDCGIDINLNNSTTFDEFYRRYGSIIINGCILLESRRKINNTIGV